MSDVSKAQVKQDVRGAFEKLVSASRALDIQAYFALFDQEKFVGLSPFGTNWNSFRELRDFVEPGFDAIQRVDSLTFNSVKITVLDSNTAILINEFEQQVTLKTGQTIEVAGGGTQVWSKDSGIWKLVSVSASNKVN